MSEKGIVTREALKQAFVDYKEPNAEKIRIFCIINIESIRIGKE